MAVCNSCGEEIMGKVYILAGDNLCEDCYTEIMKQATEEDVEDDIVDQTEEVD
jgi:formylmethanofuran dehydrogenase subunit E